MGRRSHSRALAVWANGLRVGRWLIPASGPMEFSYDPAWVESKEARPLSLSLPIDLDGLPVKGEKVGFYFDNLLPDSEAIRRRIQTRYHTRSGDAFDLLEAVGRDCVGAVQLLPEGKDPEGVFKIQGVPLSELEVERALVGAVSPPELGSYGEEDEDGFRISLAGAQEKTAFTWHERRWLKPRGATPTTHIFKLPLGLIGNRQMDMSTSLENEWLCSRILQGYGVPVAACEVKRFGDSETLVVERFDRLLHASGKYWLRLLQEDFCQATGTPGYLKYEADGGPGLAEIARVLQSSERREEDLARLLRVQLLFWMLAATDGHAKNVSIRLLPRGRYWLTPFYDVLSAWPIIGSRHDQLHPRKVRLAMALCGKNKYYKLAEIQRRHFNATAQQCGLGADMEALISEVIEKTPAVVESVGRELPRGFPAKVFETVTAGLKKAARSLEAMPAR